MLWHGKNFRGFLNKAREVLFDKTGTSLNSTNVQDAISEIDSNLSMHTFGTAVDLKSVQMPYTIPSDGYLHYSVTNGNGTSYFLFLINGLQVVIPQHSTRNTVNFVYVRQGMEVRGLVNPETALTFEFLPLV